MRKKADAWQNYQEAAMVDMVLKTLPQIAAEIAAPLARANKVCFSSVLSVLNCDQGDHGLIGWWRDRRGEIDGRSVGRCRPFATGTFT